MTVTILHGDCRDVLATLPERSVQSCVTSPPYYGLRSYLPEGHADKHREIGLEPTPDEYVAEMVAVFREVRRVLRDDGTLWLNVGDSYNNNPPASSAGKNSSRAFPQYNTGQRAASMGKVKTLSCKPKDLIGIPWMLAFALRADGWFLRSDIIWHKPNPMPESVRDRPTSAHEHVFLLTKAGRYFYDAGAIAEAAEYPGDDRHNRTDTRKAIDAMCSDGGSRARTGNPTGDTRNARNVWTIATQPYSGAHFATMPPDLAERCIKAGTRLGDTVLDPFGGAGTTGLVADRLNRNAVLIELNPEYRTLAQERVRSDAPLLAVIA